MDSTMQNPAGKTGVNKGFFLLTYEIAGYVNFILHTLEGLMLQSGKNWHCAQTV